jgi:hypothetical protein
MCIISFLLSIVPIIIIAYTNGFVDIILTTVRNSAVEDYVVIGGRERWLTYIQGNIAYCECGFEWHRVSSMITNTGKAS